MWWEKGKVPLGLEGPSRKGDREARGCPRALPLRLGLPALGERCSQAEAEASAAWSACSRGARQTPGRATASSAPSRGKASGQVRVRRRLSAINLPSPPGQPLREGADL